MGAFPMRDGSLQLAAPELLGALELQGHHDHEQYWATMLKRTLLKSCRGLETNRGLGVESAQSTSRKCCFYLPRVWNALGHRVTDLREGARFEQ